MAAPSSDPAKANGAATDLEGLGIGRLRALTASQAEKVRSLKQRGQQGSDAKAEVDREVELLLTYKKRLQKMEAELENDDSRPLYSRCRVACENLLKRRFFVAPAFEIYGGTGGLFDFGPPGCALKAEVEALWRRHFVLHEDMLEISGTCLTPHAVLKTSGHVDRFTDLMVKDTVTNDCYRADKYLEDAIDAILSGKPLGGSAGKKPPTGVGEGSEESDGGADVMASPEKRQELEVLRRQADALSPEEMDEAFEKLHLRSPEGNSFSKAFPFNLMFKSKIGPKQEDAGGEVYLRPETAQGIFVNFRRLLEFNGGRMPFAAAQLGLGFRNEIAPRNGLLRVREFQMGEIEHFVHPQMKDHPKFVSVKDLKLPLFPRDNQLTDGKLVTSLTLEEAVKLKMIDNETLAYFMARTYLFMLRCGILQEGLRFRQHLPTEMAHYASDCWDAEIECSSGWVEVVGHADRSAYDLTHHSKETKVPLCASRKFDSPQTIEFMKYVPNRGLMGKALKQDQTTVHEAIEEKSDAEKEEMEKQLAENGSYKLKLCTGQEFTLTREMMRFEKTSKRVSEETYTPAVIEPSFGIGRLIHCILEHNFRSRGIEDQEERCFLAFPAEIAPTKCSILTISNNKMFESLVDELRDRCRVEGVSCKVDTSTASIGKRYARTDEIGIPYGVTIDFQSAQDRSVTLRERDSMRQVRLGIDEVVGVVRDAVAGRKSWQGILKQYPEFFEQEVKA